MLFRDDFENRIRMIIDVEAVDGVFHHLFRLSSFPERFQMKIPIERVIVSYCIRLILQALYQAWLVGNKIVSHISSYSP